MRLNFYKMPIHTVGELIDHLKYFNRNTPILKTVVGDKFYEDINLAKGLIFHVRAVVTVDGSDMGPAVYADTPPADPHGFDAVVL